MIDAYYEHLITLINQELEDLTIDDLKNYYYDRRLDELQQEYYREHILYPRPATKKAKTDKY